MSDPILVQLDFFDPWDINGDVIFTMTDQDTYFEKIELDIQLSKLGGAVLTTSRRVGHAMFRSGIYAPEVFVRVLIPAIDEEKYLWGFFIDLRKQKLISKDEDGGEIFTIGGPGPLFYLSRGALTPEETADTAAWVNVSNWVYHWAETATAGRILNSIIRMVHATDPDALPDMTKSFTALLDSDGDAWVDDIAGTDDFELPIGQSVLADLYDLQEASDSLDATVTLGEVGAPVFELNAYQSLGRDLTAASVTDLDTGVVHFKERVNIEDELEASGTSLRRFSHVIVRGADSEWVFVARPSWDPGEYVKIGVHEYTRSKNTAVLNRVGLRWLRHQDAAENEIAFESKPGFDPENGLYMPGPDGTNGHAWLGDAVSLTTGSDPTEGTWTPLDYRNETQRLMGWKMELDDAVATSTDEKAALSWHVKPQLNTERASDNSAQKNNGTGVVCGSCLKLCEPAVVSPASCTADVSTMTQIATPNGGFETGTDANWTHNQLGGPGITGPATGAWEGNYRYLGGSAGYHVYTIPGLYSFVAGTTYVARMMVVDTGAATKLRFGYGTLAETDIGEVSAAAGGAGWVDICVEWTPTVTRTSGVEVTIAVESGLDNFDFDYVRVYGPGLRGGDDTAEFVGESPRAARCDHKTHAEDVIFGDGSTLADVFPAGTVDLTGVNFLVGTATGLLSAEIVVGTTPGGELGGTWGSPTVDSVHSGSAHVTDHGGLTGLGDDDHPQYATNAEFDDHSARHELSGADAIKLDDLSTPDDNTDLNASTSRHGLLPKLPGDGTLFLDGTGAFTEPTGSGGGEILVTDVPAGSPLVFADLLQNEDGTDLLYND